MKPRLDLSDIRLLMQIIESGSFTAASRTTGVPKSTISQRIAALERTVGTGLLRRTSRSFSLTEAGARLLPHARAIDELSRKIETELLEQGPDIAGMLRISASTVFAHFILSPIIPRFLKHHPKVSLNVEVSNRFVDLVGEGFDMAIRAHIGPLKDSILLQRVVARPPWSLTASPAWVEAHGLPTWPSELPPDQALCFSGATPDYSPWRLRTADVKVTTCLLPRLVSDDIKTLRDCTIAGGGISCLPYYIISEAVEAGHLVPILPEWQPTSTIISVLTPPRLQSSRLAQAFSNFLAAEVPRLVRGQRQFAEPCGQLAVAGGTESEVMAGPEPH